jgi:hypothetical protein
MRRIMVSADLILLFLLLIPHQAEGEDATESVDGVLRARLQVSASTLRCGEITTVTLQVESPAQAKLSLSPNNPGTDDLVLMNETTDPPRWLAGDRLISTWHWTLSAGLPGNAVIPTFTVFSDYTNAGKTASARLTTNSIPIAITSVINAIEPDTELRPLAELRSESGFDRTIIFVIIALAVLLFIFWLSFTSCKQPTLQILPQPSLKQRGQELLHELEAGTQLNNQHWLVLRSLLDALPKCPEKQTYIQRFEYLRYAPNNHYAESVALCRELLAHHSDGEP